MPLLESSPDVACELAAELARNCEMSPFASALLTAKAKLQSEFGGSIVAYRLDGDSPETLHLEVFAQGRTHVEVETLLAEIPDRANITVDYIESLDEDHLGTAELDAA